MTNNDFFVDEVNSDVREENFYKQIKKFRWVIIAIILGVVAFVAFGEFRRSQTVSQGEEQFINLTSAVTGENANDTSLLSFDSELSTLEAARLKLASGDKEGALALYQGMVDNSAFSETARELARLQVFSLEGGAEATSLANPNAPFSVEAQLVEANSLIAEGKNDEALKILEDIHVNSNSQSERGIVEATIESLGGEIPTSEDATAPTADNLDTNASE